ncbi:hypothetical protein Nstercoris_01456 [Nitrosomonas stercoris]|uniref:CRISPR system Cascade subunit CasA n=1 Tax=Nitrosomonas stercoris TaxID=1444684 RepID=A0A4Y1YME9_9PROT|nr:hypothetical protein Nstercoris_01456 [Nitrosomonas stercoris]
MENRFNLIDEPWIPIADYGKASLKEVFHNKNFQSLGGNPVQKIAVFKLLLAIAQSAATPQNETEWQALGAEGLAQKCLDYLDKWHDRFYLYGHKPFLQMPAISAARTLSFGAFLPEISTGNTTVLIQSQIERGLPESDQALVVLMQMGFALSGKKTDNSVVLSEGYAGKRNDKGKPSTGRTGPSVAHMGLLHSFVMANSLQNSIWLNLLTTKELDNTSIFQQGLGVAPWEEMPAGEACTVAQRLQQSYMGRLIPLCRFCLLTEDGMHYSEGIAHANYKDGIQDLSVAVNSSGKEPKALWTDPEKRPWRELNSLLSFIAQGGSQGFQCWQIRFGLEKAVNTQEIFNLWSGGLRVSSNAGEQYVSGSDDAVESGITIYSKAINESWFDQLKAEMTELDNLAKTLYGRVMGYFKDLTVEGKSIAANATNLFWQLCERDFQTLVEHCDYNEESNQIRKQLRRKFAGYQRQAYDHYCPNETARQIDAWAHNLPNYSKYLAMEAS